MLGLLLILATTTTALCGWLLIDGARATLAAAAAARARRPLALIVRARRELGPDRFEVELRARRRRLPAFLPGQYLTLLGGGWRRSYSLAAWQPRPRRYVLGIKRESDGQVSRELYDCLRPGTRIDALPPHGAFSFSEAPPVLVLIGGGIGVTPLRAMLHAAAAAPRGKVFLFYSARTRDELAYHDEFTELARRAPWFRYHPALTGAGDDWDGARKRLSASAIRAALLQQGVGADHGEYYLCARQDMVESLKRGLLDAGVAPAQVHVELFNIDLPAGAVIHPVHVAGRALAPDPADASVLDVLARHGCAPEVDCRAGHCGACWMTLTAGRARNLAENRVLEPGDTVATCVCIPLEPATLSPLAPAGSVACAQT
jgi:ferredoxin-NADP reductase